GTATARLLRPADRLRRSRPLGQTRPGRARNGGGAVMSGETSAISGIGLAPPPERPSIAVADLPGLVGTQLGVSGWHEITQSQITAFANATGDRQWIHVDPERAAGGPFGATIA